MRGEDISSLETKSQVKVDAAYALCVREKLKKDSGPIFVWADSSPQAGSDYLLSCYVTIARDAVVNCWDHFEKLVASVADFQAAASAEEPESLLDCVVARSASARFLVSNMKKHCQMPMSLGSGRTSVEDKGKAMAVKFHRETGDLMTLKDVCQRVSSFTSDMGTELGVPDLAGGPVEAYLPEYMRSGLLPEHDGMEDLFADLPLPPAVADHLFPRALVVPGLDHIAHNLQEDLDKNLRSWDAWLPGFKGICLLLSKQHLLKRLIATCIEGTPLASLKGIFEKTVPSIAKWRWGTICKTLPAVLSVFKPLKMVWNAEKFQQRPRTSGDAAADAGDGAEQEEDEDMKVLKVGDITSALRKPFWLAYSHMLLSLHDVANRISAWGSGCPCHGWLQPKPNAGPGVENHWDVYLREFVHDRGMRLQEDGSGFSCPMAGKRAPELAAGCLIQVLTSTAEAKKPDVLIAAAGLDRDIHDSVVTDFQTGVDFISLTVTIKLGFWKDFPWRLCSLMVPGISAEQRTEKAQELLSAFDKLPQRQEAHHRITWCFMQPQSVLREQLEKLASALSPLSDLPELQYELCVLALTPVVERVVEGQHSLVHRHAGYRQVTGAYVSLSLRMDEINDLMLSEVGKQQMISMFEKIRKPKQLAKAFKFDDHPEWLAALSKGKIGHSRLGRIAVAIMYMNDIALQFLQLTSARNKNKQHRKQQENERKKLQQGSFPAEPLSDKMVLKRLFAAHVASSLVPGEFYSMPASVLQASVSSLSSAMQFAPAPVIENNDSGRLLTDAEVAVQPPGSDCRQDIFFKVLSTRSGFLKTVRRAPASQRRLNRNDIALTFHKAVPGQHSPEACMVQSEPLMCSGEGNAVHVLSSVGMDTDKLEHMLRWKAGQQDCVMTLPNYTNAIDARLLGLLVSEKAFVGQPTRLSEASVPANMRATLQDMQHDGWVVSDSQGLQLTRDALAKLSLSYCLEDPTTFDGQPAQVPALEQQTPYQLAKALQNQGWQWKAFRANSSPPYVLGGDRVWYSQGTTVSRDYMLCLLRCDSILEAGQRVHHGQKAVYYRTLLQGQYAHAEGMLSIKDKEKQGPQRVAIEDASAAGDPQAVGDLMPEDDLLWQSAALHEESTLPTQPTPKAKQQPRIVGSRKRKRRAPESGAHNQDANSDADVSSASVNSLADLWDLFSDMASSAGAGDGDDGVLFSDIDLADYSPSIPEDVAADSVDASNPADSNTALDESRDLLGLTEDVDQAEARHDPPTTDDAPMPAAAPSARVVRPESISAWGGARCKITWRAPGDDCLHGAWQAKCPYHRRTDKTACTKSLSLAESTDEQRQLTLRMVKHWLLQAGSFDRGWKHQKWNPRSFECPPEHVLDLKAEEMRGPSDPVQPDDELDKLAARASASRPKAKAKPKAKRKPKAAAVAKRRDRPPASPQDEAASDPESSGSSSGSSSSSSSSESSDS